MMDASTAKKVFWFAALFTVACTATITFFFPYSTDPTASVVWYKRVPGFAAMLGLGGCLIMVPLVKTFAKKILQRPEEYYSTYEAKIGALVAPKPGKSLADPSAPSESEPSSHSDDTQSEKSVAKEKSAQKKMKKKKGRRYA